MDPLVAIGAVLMFVAIGVFAFMFGKRSAPVGGGEAEEGGRRLEEYSFYPFVVNSDGHVEFDAGLFSEGVRHLLKSRNVRAGRELIVIGEQNLVRDTFSSVSLQDYKRLYESYDGDGVVSDNDVFLENYKRLVSQFGRSFPNVGIEILLHNLVNPSRSLVVIENGAVTGRTIGGGATNLVLDLKTRRQRGEDKVNYELNIGSRQFKCTTVPIFRPDYGLVGAICINVDTRFVRDAVASDSERLEAFVDNLLKTDFRLDENILSKDEYRNALRGKRHYLDEAIRSEHGRAQERRLATLLFTDLVRSTEEAVRLGDNRWTELLQQHRDAVRTELAREGGREIDTAGDGFLITFEAPAHAVRCALAVVEAVEHLGVSVRCGLHTGEIEVTGDSVTGQAVHIGARIAGLAEPGEVRVSRTVKDLVQGGGFSFTDTGFHTLKGVPDKWQLFSVVNGDSAGYGRRP